MKKRTKYIIYIVLAIALVWIVSNFFVANSAPQKVTTTKISKEPIEVIVSANGKIKAQENVDLRFTSTGKINRLYVKEGDTVTQGQILAYLDGIVISEQVNKATADLRLAIEKIREYEYQHKDKPQNEEYLMTKWQLEAQRDSAQAILRQTQAGYNDKVIISPIDGVVSKVNSAIGELPPAADPVITVVNPATTEFVAEVDEQDIGEIQPGQSVTIMLDAYNNRTFKGTVTQVEAIAQTGTTGNTFYPVKMSIETENINLLIGLNGDSDILTQYKENTVSIPSETIYEENNKKFVYSVQNNKVKKLEIETGIQSDIQTEITSTIPQETEIITSDASQLKEGTTVQIDNTK